MVVEVAMQPFSFKSMLLFSCSLVVLLLPMIVALKRKHFLIDIIVVFALASIGFYTARLIF